MDLDPIHCAANGYGTGVVMHSINLIYITSQVGDCFCTPNTYQPPFPPPSSLAMADILKPFHRNLLKYALAVAIAAICIRLLLAIDDLAREEVPDFSLEKHPYVPSKPGDSRSPCPALNALANHGFLPHDGRGMTRQDYIRAMREGYNLSFPLAATLAYGGHIMLRQFSELSLSDLSRHNYIEHNASLGHMDAIGDEEYAPWRASPKLIAQLVNQSTDGLSLTMHDFAVARVRREEAYLHQPLDAIHEEIARGEMSMVLGIFGGGNDTVPIRWVKEWWLDERFPEDFVPNRVQGLWETVKGSMKLRLLMTEIRAASQAR